MAKAAVEPFPLYSNKALQTPECLYHTFDTISQDAFVEGLTPHYPLKCDVLPPQQVEEAKVFDGYWWTRWTSDHWEIPLVAGALYLIMIVGFKSYMAKRERYKLQNWVVCWNFFLSLFSLAVSTQQMPAVHKLERAASLNERPNEMRNLFRTLS